MTNQQLNEDLSFGAKDKFGLEEYTQLEIYLPYPKEVDEEPRSGRVPAISRTYKCPVQEFINREFRELNFSSRNIFGNWDGIQEHSVVITHLVNSVIAKPALDLFVEIAEKFKKEFNQEAVLITVTPIKVNFV